MIVSRDDSLSLNPDPIRHLTINRIQKHVNEQPNAKQSCFFVNTQQAINEDEPGLMQWMKANTAARGIIDGSCYKVIEIHQHGCQHQ